MNKAYGDALFRIEAAEIATASSLMALVGARVASEKRGTEHEIRKNFLVTTLEAANVPSVALLDALETTKRRNIAQYNAAMAATFLKSGVLDILHQRARRTNKSLGVILAEAGITPITIDGYPETK